ncbi:MAG: DUF2911 domain-containing protein [Ferruginibacter sp.]
MKFKILFILFAALYGSSVFSQGLITPPDGGNKKATTAERIGITDVTIHYDRPAVKGRDGKIWGGLVHKGFMDLGFGTSKAAPWRAGANENTTFTFSTDVKIEGQPLAAGTYGFFIAMGDGTATLIFSKNATAWGSFFYKESEDVLRVNVKTAPLAESVERLKYEFSDEKDNSAVVALYWEKLKIPFTVEVDYVKTQMESFRKELQSDKGFEWKAYDQAADFAAEHKTNLDEALEWSNYSINGVFVGQKNFKTLSTKAKILSASNKNAEADAVMKEAMPMATMQELHAYGRQLLREKKNKEALEVFIANGKKYPNVFTTNMGLMRAYSANGDYANALKYAKAAQPQAPDKANKDALENFVKMLEAGKDINMPQ